MENTTITPYSIPSRKASSCFNSSVFTIDITLLSHGLSWRMSLMLVLEESRAHTDPPQNTSGWNSLPLTCQHYYALWITANMKMSF